MKIIADCGATSSDWRVIHDNGSITSYAEAGINASAMLPEYIRKIISGIGKKISVTDDSAAEIYLYMAGLPSLELHQEIKNIFSSCFPVKNIDIQNDLIAAARAVWGCKPGIVAILGTGSNSCQWDGSQPVKRVYSSGFILGDEGSGATLGKVFISDFLKGLVPETIASDFSSRYPSDYDTIIKNVYKSETSPSGYLGSFAPFIIGHYDNPYIKELVDGNFRAFFRRCICQYDTDRYSVGIVGGFGHALKDTITRIASESGISISDFVKTPIDRLVEYHR